MLWSNLKTIKRKILPQSIKKTLSLLINHIRGFDSQNYWENRYKNGGNSGRGSYGKLANFKADVLNKFVNDNSVKTVLEFGSGDGNQLSLFKFPNYVGLDVSPTSIKKCIARFGNDKTKSFFLYKPSCFSDKQNVFSADLTMSLDVVYHLVEDKVFEKYMKDLFDTSNNYVIIYSSNIESKDSNQAVHVRHREFTTWVDENINGWKLQEIIKNDHLFEEDAENGSFADFFIYKKS